MSSSETASSSEGDKDNDTSNNTPIAMMPTAARESSAKISVLTTVSHGIKTNPPIAEPPTDAKKKRDKKKPVLQLPSSMETRSEKSVPKKQ